MATMTLMDSYDLAEVEMSQWGVLVTLNGALTIGNLTQNLGSHYPGRRI